VFCCIFGFAIFGVRFPLYHIICISATLIQQTARRSPGQGVAFWGCISRGIWRFAPSIPTTHHSMFIFCIYLCSRTAFVDFRLFFPCLSPSFSSSRYWAWDLGKRLAFYGRVCSTNYYHGCPCASCLCQALHSLACLIRMHIHSLYASHTPKSLQ
jgi:hypothetical protein